MIRRALTAATKFLGSARLATWLLVFVGVWSMLASFVPQESTSAPAVAQWAMAFPAVASAARLLGLHHAFSAPVFEVAVLLLGISTAICAWRRTKVALSRMRVLRDSQDADSEAVAASHNIEIECRPDSSVDEVLAAASAVFAALGIKAKKEGSVLAAVGPSWSVWGSPVFHWGLVALLLVLFAGGLQRSEGLMGVAVGQTRADVPESYGVFHEAPLYKWLRTERAIRVDDFDRAYRTGKIDRGPTPTVSVLDSQGRVIKTQRVYPNSPLETGSLTIHPSNYGFAATLVVLDVNGAERGRAIQLVDISETATEGTVPVEWLAIKDSAGNEQLSVAATVPMVREDGVLGLGAERNARLTVVTPSGAPVLNRVVRPGETLALPTGEALRLENLDFYARLSIVDDHTIPLLYAAFAVAMLGLTLAVVGRQQSVLATAVEAPGGCRLYVAARFWRNAPTDRAELESELTKALKGAEKERLS